jgi:hypothetical protein
MRRKPTTQITLNVDYKLGPAMTALNSRQRAFVIALCTSGGKNVTECVRAAGYSISNAKQYAYRLAHYDSVQAAIREEVIRRQQSMAPMAQANIEKIANATGHKDQLSANKLLLGLAGHSPIIKSEHVVTHQLSTKEMVDKIRQLGAMLGDEVVKKLLPPTIDITPDEA